jgi:hypothetical protein
MTNPDNAFLPPEPPRIMLWSLVFFVGMLAP